MELKDIKGYNGKYKVSACGKVYKVKDDNLIEVAQVLTGEPQYKYVNLKGEHKRKLVRVHRLVAEAFCTKEDGCTIVDHIDRDKFNNHYINLRWTNHSGNQRNRDNNRLIDGVFLIDLLQQDYGHTNYCDWFIDNNFTADLDNYIKGKEVRKFYQEHGRPILKDVEWWGIKYKTEVLAALLNVECTTITKSYIGYTTTNKPIYQIPTEIQGVFICCFSYSSLAKYLGCSEDVAKVCLESGMTLKQYKQKQEERHWEVRIIGGIKHYGTLDMLCEYYNTNLDRVRARMERQGDSLEVALTAPTRRVNKWSVDGVTMTAKAMCELFNIDSKKFNNLRRKGKSVGWLKDYFKINNSIFPIV